MCSKNKVVYKSVEMCVKDIHYNLQMSLRNFNVHLNYMPASIGKVKKIYIKNKHFIDKSNKVSRESKSYFSIMLIMKHMNFNYEYVKIR